MMMRFTLLLLVVLISVDSFSQGKEKFGKISMEEMEMKSYSRDTTAHAVVLLDRGHFRGSQFTFDRYLKIKIFTAGGTSAGNITVRTESKADIHGFTHNLENGEIVSTKLDNSNIYKEEIVEGYKVYKIFFPNVKAGSIIELQYTLDGLPYDWYFQSKIPQIRNELIMQPVPYVVFKKTYYGFENVKEVKRDHWVAENVPGIVEEPYMSDYSNYLSRFHFELQSVYNKHYAMTWQNVAEQLDDQPFFAGLMRDGAAFLNTTAKEISANQGSVAEKVNAAYDYIRQNIKWNGTFSLFASREYRENFKKDHTGNSAEVNLMLIALLKKSGVNAVPVVLSTRENGVVNPMSPTIVGINHVVAFVQEDSLQCFLDATSRFTAPGVLPVHSLNLSGWIADKKNAQEVELTPVTGHVMRQYIRIAPNESDELVAEITNTHEGYEYLEWIQRYDREGTTEAYQKFLQTKFSNIDIDNYEVKAIKKEVMQSVEKITVNLSGTEYLEELGGELIINPFVLSEIENPFKSETRKFPIDFIFPRGRSAIISISLPEGYEITDVPQSARLNSLDGTARFSFLSNHVQNTINIRMDLVINKQIYSESSYEELRAFYSEVVRTLNQFIQARKKT